MSWRKKYSIIRLSHCFISNLLSMNTITISCIRDYKSLPYMYIEVIVKIRKKAKYQIRSSILAIWHAYYQCHIDIFALDTPAQRLSK